MEEKLIKFIASAIDKLYNKKINSSLIQIQETRAEFTGDITLVVFPLLRFSEKSPEITAQEIGGFLKENIIEIEGYNVIKGFLNLEISKSTWVSLFIDHIKSYNKTFQKKIKPGMILVEYSSPNTNKPLHLGHIRNNLLGYSVSRILEANGYSVTKTNIVNDRGIHICKSMLAWKQYGNGETPDSTNTKGDHLVGKYYVRFEKEHSKQVHELIKSGIDEKTASNSTLVLQKARELLRKWESGDKETVELWQMMNSWVYRGFDETYMALGVDFDKIYYESDTYKHGRKIVEDALEKGILYREDDGSVWADLTDDGLDRKLLMRADGTAVYMTQDLGTAVDRYNDYKFDRQYYVVGNEQNYHFQVLRLLLKKLGYEWYKGIHHYSYGMVELPEGRMKSREGTIVDADDLIREMVDTAREMSRDLGKLENYTHEEKEDIFRMIGLGALKYYILKVDPKKNMLFNPAESIDFNGNTGPFIQYTYARINSLIKKAGKLEIMTDLEINPQDKEIRLIKNLKRFPVVVEEAGESQSPALIANYCYELAKEFNQFYHDYTILGEADDAIRMFRIQLSKVSGDTLKMGMNLLGIEMPERM